VFADRPELLEARPEVLAAHRSLVTQAYRLFGSHHYQHYDFLFGLSDQIPFSGTEHHQSSEDSTIPLYFADWDNTPYDRDLLAHEFTHSWNGKFRRPADLWTPSYEVPMQDSLLWVYEGQTEYWGFVLTARAGLWNRTQALDVWAENAAWYSSIAGRTWRPLQDTTNDEIINPRRPLSWESWQRFEDYYDEGALIWLDADTLIRERSAGKRSLDDFAAHFFGVNDGSFVPLTYTFEDLVKALNVVEPYDWAAFLRQRLDGVARPAPLDGLARGGYRLIYTDKQNEYEKGRETERKVTTLRYSLGIDVDEKGDAGTIINVMWGSPAFEAAITEGMQIIAINGEAYSADLLKRTITAAATSPGPIELILKLNDRYRVVHVDYHGGLRYPHLERDATATPLLDAILAPRT
jgi:predicted metalloprotease with PDZ domain